MADNILDGKRYPQNDMPFHRRIAGEMEVNMFDVNKLDEECRRFYDEIPQIARDAMQKSGARFSNLRDMQDYYYDYVHGFDNVLYQNTPDTNSSEMDMGDSYAVVEDDPEDFELAGGGEDETEYIRDNFK